MSFIIVISGPKQDLKVCPSRLTLVMNSGGRKLYRVLGVNHLLDPMLCPSYIGSPFFKGKNDSSHLFIIYRIISFGIGEFLAVESQRMNYAVIPFCEKMKARENFVMSVSTRNGLVRSSDKLKKWLRNQF